METKNRLRYFLEYVFILGLSFFLRSLPDKAGAAFGRGLGRFLGRVAGSRTRLAAANMRAAMPDASERRIEEWVGQCWENLGQAVWEFARIPSLSKEAYFARVGVEGLEHIRASHAQGKGVILVSAHYANWEMTSQFMALSGFPLAAVARRIKNPYVDEFVNRVRSGMNIRILHHKNAVRESIRWLKQGGLLGILIDQRITAGGVSVPFFGRPAHTTSMPALLSLRLGSPVHMLHAWREGEKIRIRVDPALDLSGLTSKEDDIIAATAKMSSIVESWARERPPMWLWIHDRWK